MEQDFIGLQFYHTVPFNQPIACEDDIEVDVSSHSASSIVLSFHGHSR